MDSQKCWIWLCSKFSNEIDAEFFKEYWVPIEMDEYGIYMDLSDKSYPIFSIEYFWYEPYRWYKKFLFKNVQELLLSPDVDIDIKEILNKNDKEKWQQVKDLFDERLDLVFKEKIKIEDFKTDDLKCLKSEIKSYTTTPIHINDSVILTDVSALIDALLPPEINIIVVNLESTLTTEISMPYYKVKKISEMVFFLQSKGFRFIKKYHIEIIDGEGGVIFFENNIFLLRTIDKSVTSTLISNYLKLNKI